MACLVGDGPIGPIDAAVAEDLSSDEPHMDAADRLSSGAIEYKAIDAGRLSEERGS
jgi:hypothetical protein